MENSSPSNAEFHTKKEHGSKSLVPFKKLEEIEFSYPDFFGKAPQQSLVRQRRKTKKRGVKKERRRAQKMKIVIAPSRSSSSSLFSSLPSISSILSLLCFFFVIMVYFRGFSFGSFPSLDLNFVKNILDTQQSTFLPRFQKVVESLDATNATQVALLSHHLLDASNALNDVSHFSKKFTVGAEAQEIQDFQNDIDELVTVCKSGYKKGLSIFAQSRAFVTTAARRLDLIVVLARDRKISNAGMIMMRMIEAIQKLIEEHEELDDMLEKLSLNANHLIKSATGMVRENLILAGDYSQGWSISQKLLFYSLGSLGGWPGMAAVAGFHWFDNENNDRQSREYTRIAHDFDEIWKILHLARDWIQIGIEELQNLIIDLEEAKTSLQSVGIELQSNEIVRLELAVDLAKGSLEALAVEYSDLITRRAKKARLPAD